MAEEQGIRISTEKAGKRFNREWIFRNLSFDFLPGRTYVLKGPNGSGKSTLLQVLSGMVPQTTGAIEYRVNNVIAAVDTVFKHLSIAAPYMDLIEELTLAEHLKFHFSLKSIREGVTIEQLTSILYLENSKQKFIHNFSSGMKQRLKLALAFYSQAKLIFLDEPGTNLDETAFKWYLAELEKVAGKATIVIASNNPNEYPSTAEVLNLEQLK